MTVQREKLLDDQADKFVKCLKIADSLINAGIYWAPRDTLGVRFAENGLDFENKF